MNVAVTDLSLSMVSWHGPVPVHAPDHPAKEEPGEATAVRVTGAPDGKEWEQVAPQLIAAGELVTVPEPVPALVTERTCWTGVGGGTVRVAMAGPALLPLPVCKAPMASELK